MFVYTDQNVASQKWRKQKVGIWFYRNDFRIILNAPNLCCLLHHLVWRICKVNISSCHEMSNLGLNFEITLLLHVTPHYIDYGH